MIKAGVEAVIISYNTGINACAEAHEVAEHWLSEMVEAGVEANTIGYNTVLKAGAEARDAARAGQ